MHDDKQQQGSLGRPSSRKAWLLLAGVTLAAAAIVLLGHDAASADPILGDSGQAVPAVTSATTVTADAPSPPDAPPDDGSWTSWLSSFGVPTSLSTGTPAPPESSPPPSDNPSANEQKPGTSRNPARSSRGHDRNADGSRAGDLATATDGEPAALTGTPMIGWSPHFGGPTSLPTTDDRATARPRPPRSPVARVTTTGSQGAHAPASSGENPANSDPAPLPVPAVPCPPPAVASIGIGGTFRPAPATTAPPPGPPQFTLSRTTDAMATAADPAATDARAANGSRGPPDEKAS